MELVCVDTSLADPEEDVHRFFQDPAHLRWLRETFTADADAPRWRIPFLHHPAYCAGPEHGNDPEVIETLVPLFRSGGVTHVVSGAGGKLRESVPEGLADAHTEAWAMQAHVLLEIDGDTARLTPVSGLRPDGSAHRMTALSPHNDVCYPPFVVRAGGAGGSP